MKVWVVIYDWGYDGKDIIGVAATPEDGMRLAEEHNAVERLHEPPITWRRDEKDPDLWYQSGPSPGYQRGYEVDAHEVRGGTK